MSEGIIPSHTSHKTVREPIVDGIFYPGEKDVLYSEIEKLFKTADQTIADTAPREAAAIISPHAGYTFSGHVAAAAFLAARNRKINTAVIVGPVHRDPRDEIYLTESTAFKTPLGEIAVNEQLVEEMNGFSNKIVKNDIPHLEEHCIETQLPFIQYLFPDADIVPILMGKSSMTNTELLVQLLQFTVADMMDTTLFIVSANMSAYKTLHDAKEGYEACIHMLQEKKWRQIIHAAEHGTIGSCGAGGIACLLALFGEKIKIDIMKTDNSSRLGDKTEKIIYYAGISMSKEDNA
jgi:MEMO1 family protein